MISKVLIVSAGVVTTGLTITYLALPKSQDKPEKTSCYGVKDLGQCLKKVNEEIEEEEKELHRLIEGCGDDFSCVEKMIPKNNIK